jgi:hypothetical protein
MRAFRQTHVLSMNRLLLLARALAPLCVEKEHNAVPVEPQDIDRGVRDVTACTSLIAAGMCTYCAHTLIHTFMHPPPRWRSLLWH